MKKKFKQAKSKCLKYAFEKKEMKSIMNMLRSNDNEIRQLAEQLILSSRVYIHNKEFFNQKKFQKYDGSPLISVFSPLLQYMCK